MYVCLYVCNACMMGEKVAHKLYWVTRSVKESTHYYESASALFFLAVDLK